MKDWKKIVIDSPDMWPNTTHVDLEQPFVDERGYIQHLVNTPMKNIALIKSVTGALRANHYHLKDWHYCYVISGCIEYYERKVGDNSKPIKNKIKAGEMFYTPPMVEHAMLFPEDTVFLTLAGGTRTEKDYESDLVRVKLI